MSHGLWQFLMIWFVLVVLLLVVLGIYYAAKAAAARRAQQQAARRAAAASASAGAADPSVPRPSSPPDLEYREPVAAHTTDVSTIKEPGPLPRWFSRKTTEEPEAAAVTEPEFEGDFVVDPAASGSTRFERQGEVRHIATEVQAVETTKDAQLRTLEGLRAQGFITDEEYEARRAAILGA